jgi:hypothetical protein
MIECKHLLIFFVALNSLFKAFLLILFSELNCVMYNFLKNREHSIPELLNQLSLLMALFS